MHDPMTVAFEIPRPWPEVSTMPNGKIWSWRPPILVVWHRDPERRGDDDSCGWFQPHLTKAELEFCERLIKDPDDNLRWFFGDASQGDMIWRLAIIWRNFKKFHRPRWQHPRWHFWHWWIQIPAIRDFKRWAFSRCAKCGGRFTWGYSPVSDQWNGGGPRWFRSEPHTYHHDCSRPGDKHEAEGVVAPMSRTSEKYSEAKSG